MAKPYFSTLYQFSILCYVDTLDLSSVTLIVSPFNAIITQEKQVLGSKARIIHGLVGTEGEDEVLSFGSETDSTGDQGSISSYGRSRSPSPVRSLHDEDVHVGEEGEDAKAIKSGSKDCINGITVFK